MPYSYKYHFNSKTPSVLGIEKVNLMNNAQR